MKQKLHSRQYFLELSEEGKYKLLHNTELTVKRLERIIEILSVFKDGSEFYEKAYKEYQDYCEEM